jgi:membrane protein
LTLLPYYPSGQEVLLSIERSLPEFLHGKVGDFIISLIGDLKIPRGGLLSFGAIAAVYFASNGMEALFRGFEKHDRKAFRVRSWIERRLLAIGLTLVLFLLIFAAVVLVIIGSKAIDLIAVRMHLDFMTQLLLTVLRYLVVILILYTGISFIYKFGPAQKKRSKFFSPGAMTATIFCIVSTMAFGFFIDHYSTYNQLYGAISALIVAMVWIQIVCFVILVGFELNASIAVGTYSNVEEE